MKKSSSAHIYILMEEGYLFLSQWFIIHIFSLVAEVVKLDILLAASEQHNDNDQRSQPSLASTHYYSIGSGLSPSLLDIGMFSQCLCSTLSNNHQCFSSINKHGQSWNKPFFNTFELILSSIAEGIIGQLGDAAVKKIGLLWGVEEELDQLEGTITTLKGVLADAEKQQSHTEQIRIQLQKYEDVVYEADDLVDEFSTEALRQQVMSGRKMLKQVRTFCSPSNQFVFRHKMGRRIRDIRKKLDVIAGDKKFHLELGLGLGDTKLVSPGEWETHSFVPEEQVVGRDDDKMAIMNLIFDNNPHENIGVIAIVGAGGLGKTTLAQLVFNDEKVKEHFELTMWVNVPEDFNVKLVVMGIIKSGQTQRTSIEDDSMDELQKKLRQKIDGKRYFLVLDDVWNDNHLKWQDLENLLRNGANGSRVIVTTRSEKVANIVMKGSMEPYFLGKLEKGKSWELFKKLAFKKGQEPEENILQIGKEILEKCGGNPLVIKTIGSMLGSIKPEDQLKEWSSLKEKEMSKVSEFQDNILPILKLSYDRLPSHLKHCFVYCSLFPKNFGIDVQQLIQLWMAQGFIKLSSDSHQLMEDVGYEHFRDLLWRSFFQEVGFDEFSGNVQSCKMHDYMHDLATSIAGTRNVMLSLHDGNKIDKRTVHVSFVSFHRNFLQQFSTSADHATRIRTFFSTGYFSCSTDRLLKFGLKFSRTLDLHGSGIAIFPTSIANMKHLRYLDLSHNGGMEALPDSITRLVNLQTLDLSWCTSLRALPGGITKLVNLRHLKTTGCGLTHMPRGIGQLTNLQTLSLFVVDDDKTCAWRHPSGELNELENLNNLRGELIIVVRKDGIQSKAANLKNKQNLHSLELVIGGTIVDNCEGFLPLPDLKVLNLSGDHIHLCVPLLKWVPSLGRLVRFSLTSNKECQYPPPLNNLPCLKVLHLQNLPALEYISSNNDKNFFPSLQTLALIGIPNLKGWWKLDVMNIESNASLATNISTIPFFPCLSTLYVIDCPKLISMPLYPYLEHLYLENTSLNPFEQTSMMINVGGQSSNQASSSKSTSSTHLASNFLPLSKLETLWIENVDLQCLPDQGFKSLASLKYLTISNCGALQSLSPGIQHLTSLQVLDIRSCKELDMSDAATWQNLRSLRALRLWMLSKLVALSEGLQQVISLQGIQIWSCDNLVEIMECVSSLKSLKELDIRFCRSLRSLPEGIDCLPSLQRLYITWCPLLLERCRKDTGDYWPKICHIKDLNLYPSPEDSTSSKNIGLFNCFKIRN